jgi:hypothetical protein
MAQNYQSILASSAALEGQFSQISDTANPRKRNRLSKVRINQLACLKSWNKVLLTVDPESDESEGSDFPVSVSGDQLESSDESELSD